MQYDQKRVLRPRSAAKPTINQITLLSLVVLVFVFSIVFIVFRLILFNRASVHIQGVHKVFRQFKKFIAEAVDEISYIHVDLFYINQCLLKFLVILKFVFQIKFLCLIIVLIKPCKMAAPQEKAQFSHMFLVTHF